MNIKTRLSIEFTLTVFGILVFFSILVYYFSYNSHLSKFRKDLLVKAQNTAILLINVEEVDSSLLKKIHQTTKSLVDEEIALADSSDNIIYGNKNKLLSDAFVASIPSNSKKWYFSVGQKDGVLYKHVANKKTYHVFVAAHDQDRKENLGRLRSVLLWSILFSLWLSVTASYFFSKVAIKPITKIIAKVKEINSSRLNSRLDEGKQQDEIEQLAITFNQMLSELEQVFKSQEEFVSNASHELRTPMAIMIAESDYIRSRERQPGEYKKHLEKLSNDLRALNQLLNSLLELAQINRDKEINMGKIRLDELVFNAIQAIKKKYPGKKIMPRIAYPDQEDDLMVVGNAGLLEIAIKNLIDNACKFSDSEVEVKIEIIPEKVILSVTDRGIGIPSNDFGTIFTPFSRGANVRYISGFGVGLSIVARIIHLHHAEIKVISSENEGTRIELSFRKEKNYLVKK